MRNKKISDMLVSGAIQIVPFSDKILYDDNDGDGIPNKWDASPDEPIDTNFLYVDNIDKYTIDDIYHSVYLENIERAKKTYNSVEHEWHEGVGDELLNYIMSIGGFTIFSTFVQALEDKELAFGATPVGARSLMHYLNNSGKDLKLDPTIPVGIVKSQRKKYYDQMNNLFELAEQSLIPGKEYSFITTKNTDDTWLVNYYLNRTNQDEAAMDWWLTIGGGRNGVKTTISCTTDTTNKKYYTANIEYFLYDFYDWDEEKEKELADLHKFGKAQSFRQYGSFLFKVHWTQGSRYPASSHDDRYGNLDIVEFTGVDDELTLSFCRNNAKHYYE